MSENFDQIEKYIFGRMSADEQAAFELEIANDPALAEQVALHRAEHRAMHLGLKDDLRENLKTWKAEKNAMTENTSTARVVALHRRRFLYAAAAAVALLIGIFVVDWSGSDTDALADDFFEETSPTVRGTSGSEPAALGSALEKMLEKNYETALAELGEVRDTDYLSITLLLKGESYYRLGDYARASDTFSEAMQVSGPAANRQKAEWYLLLTLLKSGADDRGARELLEKIQSEPGHAFYPEAEKVANALE